MKAVLLCAGYATRLYPLTQNQPKPLLPIAGRPMIDYLLLKIEEEPSIDQVFLVTNDRFFPHFKDWAKAQNYRWPIEVVNDGTKTSETRLGAIGDLNFFLKHLRLREDLGVFAGDNLFDLDLKKFFAFAKSHRPHASVGVVDVEIKELASRYGVVRLDQNRRVVEFLEKPKNPPSTLASTGIYALAKEGLDLLDRYIREGHNADRIGDFLNWLVQIDEVFGFPFKGIWFDIGDLNSYQKADRYFQTLTSNPHPSKG